MSTASKMIPKGQTSRAPSCDEWEREAARKTPAGLAWLASNRQFRYAPHVELLDRKLYDLATGRTRFLMVTMPPRHGKSEFCSKYFTAWCVGCLKKRVILTSYEATFAASWGRKARDILEEWSPLLYDVRVSGVSSAADWWELEGGQGSMMTAGAGGAITGKGGDILICDDPIKNAQEASSQLIRDHLWDWYTSTFYTRREPGASMLLIQTRWNTDDLAGRLLRDMGAGGDQWDVLNLPAIAEQDELIVSGDFTFTRQEGEPLWSERYPLPILEKMRAAVGPYVWSALYQQRPVPKEGSTFKLEWMNRRYRELPKLTSIVQVVDSAFKEGVASDNSVIATWGSDGIDYYLMHIWRGRVAFPELITAIKDQFARFKPRAVCIEDKASGQSAIQVLRRETALPVIAIPADGSKELRADLISPLFEAGKVMLPESAEWLDAWIDEHVNFPRAAHDDQVDTTSYALQYFVAHDASHALAFMQQWRGLTEQRRAAIPPEHPIRTN